MPSNKRSRKRESATSLRQPKRPIRCAHCLHRINNGKLHVLTLTLNDGRIAALNWHESDVQNCRAHDPAYKEILVGLQEHDVDTVAKIFARYVEEGVVTFTRARRARLRPIKRSATGMPVPVPTQQQLPLISENDFTGEPDIITQEDLSAVFSQVAEQDNLSDPLPAAVHEDAPFSAELLPEVIKLRLEGLDWTPPQKSALCVVRVSSSSTDNDKATWEDIQRATGCDSKASLTIAACEWFFASNIAIPSNPSPCHEQLDIKYSVRISKDARALLDECLEHTEIKHRGILLHAIISLFIESKNISIGCWRSSGDSL